MSHQGFDITFKEFKERFYCRVGDGSCLDVLDINLLKVTLDGLKVRYSDRGKISDHLNNPLIVLFAYYLTKTIFSLFKAIKLNLKKRKLINIPHITAFAERTHNYNGKMYSYYYQNIYERYGRENFCYIKKIDSTPLNSEISFSDMVFNFNIFSIYNIKLLIGLKRKVDSLKRSGKWDRDELRNIRIAYFLFFNEYLKYNSFFRGMKFNDAIIDCHYHEEGFILACRKNKIKVIELQHGLISKEDIFFVFPEEVTKCMSKALFADHILVYGDYWRNVLLKGVEYKQEQIGIIGFYPFEKEIEVERSVINKKSILVTTQYSISSYYIDYVKWLSTHIDEYWEIIVKTHPNESKEIYNELLQLNNVSIRDENLNQLIDQSEFTISIFSTTLFDSVRKGKIAFALNIDFFKDYVLDIVSTGAIYQLEVNEDPIKKFKSIDIAKHKRNNSYLYTDFDPSVYLDGLMNLK